MNPDDYETVRIMPVRSTMREGRRVQASGEPVDVQCHVAPSMPDMATGTARITENAGYDLYARGTMPLEVMVGDLATVRGRQLVIDRVPAVWRRGSRDVGWQLHATSKERA